MTRPRPTAEELVQAVRTFLDTEVLPTLDGRLKFHTRVAVNVLDAVERELRDGPAADAAERAGLVGLVGAGDRDDDGAEALSRDLARRIRAGEVDIADSSLLDHLRATARADLAVANPKHLQPDTETA